MSPSQQPADAAKPPTLAQPLRQSVRALGVPEEVGRRVEQISQERGYGRRSGRRKELEDELLLHYHFGGLSVFYRVTPDDLIVLAAGRLGTEEFCRVTEALGADERRDALFDSVNPWDDDVSQLLGPESDAG